MKHKIRIIDNQFSHCASNSFGTGDLVGLQTRYFDWHRGNQNTNDVVVITENSINEVYSCTERIKILLIIEPSLINPNIYSDIRNPELYNKFDYVLTHSRELVAVNPSKFFWYAFSGCWIYPNDYGIHPKTKGVSICASNKTATEGHRLRHDAIRFFRDKIDGVYGNGYKFVENKIIALKDFRYHIVIENDSTADWFSEKVIDAFMTGTIPIYRGCAGNIGKYFNPNGILQFNTLHELENALLKADENFYYEQRLAVRENFDIAKKYLLPEDELWLTFFNPIIFNIN